MVCLEDKRKYLRNPSGKIVVTKLTVQLGYIVSDLVNVMLLMSNIVSDTLFSILISTI